MATKTSRSSGRQHRPQQSPHHTQTAKDDDDIDDEDELEDKSRDSLESRPLSASPRCLSRDDVLATLGYRSGNPPQPSAHTPQTQRSSTCRRCGKKVYPLELIDIGDKYHRGCFKCYVSASASFAVSTLVLIQILRCWYGIQTVITSDKGGSKCFCPCSYICLSVSLSVSKITKNACMDLSYKRRPRPNVVSVLNGYRILEKFMFFFQTFFTLN